MKKLTKELKSKTVVELNKEARSLREEIARLDLEAKANPPAGSSKDTNLLFKKRKRLAVILTLVSQKTVSEK